MLYQVHSNRSACVLHKSTQLIGDLLKKIKWHSLFRFVPYIGNRWWRYTWPYWSKGKWGSPNDGALRAGKWIIRILISLIMLVALFWAVCIHHWILNCSFLITMTYTTICFKENVNRTHTWRDLSFALAFFDATRRCNVAKFQYFYFDGSLRKTLRNCFKLI